MLNKKSLVSDAYFFHFLRSISFACLVLSCSSQSINPKVDSKVLKKSPNPILNFGHKTSNPDQFKIGNTKFRKLEFPQKRNLQLAGECSTSIPAEAPSAFEIIDFYEPKSLAVFSRPIPVGDYNQTQLPGISIDAGIAQGSVLEVFDVGVFKSGLHKGSKLLLLKLLGPEYEPWLDYNYFYRLAWNEKAGTIYALPMVSGARTTQKGEGNIEAEAEVYPEGVEHQKSNSSSSISISVKTLAELLKSNWKIPGPVLVDEKFTARELLIPECLSAGGVAFQHTGSKFSHGSAFQDIYWKGESSGSDVIRFLEEPTFGLIIGRGYRFEAYSPDGVISKYQWFPPSGVRISDDFAPSSYRNCFLRGDKRESDVPMTESSFTNSPEDFEEEKLLVKFSSSTSAGELFRLREPNENLLKFSDYLRNFKSHYETPSFFYSIDNKAVKEPPPMGVPLDEPQAIAASEARAKAIEDSGWIPNPDFELSSERPYSLTELHKLNPIVYVRSPFGDFFTCQDDWLYRDRWSEPIVYLYAPSETTFQVSLSEKIGLELVRPKIENRAWTVTTRASGWLHTHTTKEEVPYLFWEGAVEKGDLPKNGFVVSGSESNEFFARKLHYLGMSNREIRDFLKFWAEYNQRSPFFFVHFLKTEEIERRAPVEVLPEPDTRIRISMFVSARDSFIAVPPQDLIPGPKRKGKVFVEWGVVGF